MDALLPAVYQDEVVLKCSFASLEVVVEVMGERVFHAPQGAEEPLTATLEDTLHTLLGCPIQNMAQQGGIGRTRVVVRCKRFNVLFEIVAGRRKAP